MARQTIAEQLERARRTLSIIATDAALQARLAAVGYDAATLATGQTLYDQAIGARTATHAAHGDQIGATVTVNATRATVEQQVSALSQTARTLFANDPDALETLGLRMGARATPEASSSSSAISGGSVVAAPPARTPSQSQAALLDRARTLYDGALGDPALLAALAAVGYSQARLDAEQAQVAALEDADIAQEGHKVDAQSRTASQQEALEALNTWLSRLRGIARPALRDQPALLQKLGM